MSRVDEALRLAAGAAAASDDCDAVVSDDLHAHAIDPSILDRYAVERPAPAPEGVQPRAAQVVAALRAAPAVRSVPFNPALEGKLVVSGQMPPVAVEQYRRLAAVLHDLRLQQGLKTVMVSSAVLQEGKTLTIANLALTLSESYHQRVLLIDADLRRPALHEVFGVANDTGLADVARAGDARPAYVQISPCLSLLTAGRAVASPLAILTSDHVRAAFIDAAARFDWVLIDTPPVGMLPDAQLVARLTDGVLFVIAAGATPYALVKRCITELGADRIIGTILNRVEQRVLPTDSYGSYYPDARR